MLWHNPTLVWDNLNYMSQTTQQWNNSTFECDKLHNNETIQHLNVTNYTIMKQFNIWMW